MRVAVIGVPGAWSTERLASALGQAGADPLVVDLAACSLRLPDPRLFHQGRPVEGLAGALVKKIGDTAEGPGVIQRLNLLHHLERTGVPVLSPPGRLEVAANRYRMTLELARAGVPLPDTLVTEDPAEAEAAVERFGAAVVKPLYTSKGRGMQRVDPSLDLRAFFARWRHETGPIYLQRFIKHPGRDLGLAVLEGKCLGAYWRVARDDQWMTTIHSGAVTRLRSRDPKPLRSRSGRPGTSASSSPASI
jgi:ribosomal protein S6--L-glutamate ligase